MSRAIKVENHVYDQLDVMRQKSETFSQVIERLLELRTLNLHLLTQIEGVLRYREWQYEQLQKAAAADRRGDIPEVSHVQTG